MVAYCQVSALWSIVRINSLLKSKLKNEGSLVLSQTTSSSTTTGPTTTSVTTPAGTTTTTVATTSGLTCYSGASGAQTQVACTGQCMVSDDLVFI